MATIFTNFNMFMNFKAKLFIVNKLSVITVFYQQDATVPYREIKWVLHCFSKTALRNVLNYFTKFNLLSTTFATENCQGVCSLTLPARNLLDLIKQNTSLRYFRCSHLQQCFRTTFKVVLSCLFVVSGDP